MNIITVTSNADNGDGSLRAAIANAQPGDTIQFTSSLANQTITLTSGQIEIPLGKSLTIDGAAAPNLTISGNNASPFLLDSDQNSPTNLAVKNLTIANQQGSGLLMTGVPSNSTLVDNNANATGYSGDGGAISTGISTSTVPTTEPLATSVASDSSMATASGTGNSTTVVNSSGNETPVAPTVADSSTPSSTPVNSGIPTALETVATVPNNNSVTALPVANHQLGTNLNGIVDWSSELPFLDAFKSSRPWFNDSVNSSTPADQSKLDLDQNGWVKSLTKPGDPSTKYPFVGTLLDREILTPPGMKEPYAGGKYVVTYDGEGKLDYAFDAKLDPAASKPGRDVIDVTPSEGGIFLKITQTDPKGTGNYIRNIHVVPEAYENTYQSQVFNPDFLKKVGNFAAFRFMDWMGTNNSTQGDWNNRPTPQTASYFQKGAPVEVMVDLANRTGENPWFNMPFNATDEYVTNFAKIVKEKLNPNLKVYVEYSNEVWNYSFGQHQSAEQQAQKIGSDWMGWYGQRTDQIGRIWNNVFGKDSNRVETVLGGQAVNPWVADQEMQRIQQHDPHPAIKAIAIAPYFGPVADKDNQAQIDSWTKEPDGGLNKLFTELFQGGVLTHGGTTKGAIPDVLNGVAGHAALAKKYGLDLVAYEGGQGLASAFGTENDQAITDLFTKANRDPRMGELYRQYLEGWNKLGGGLFMNFSDISASTKWGYWGALEHVNQNSSPKWDALMNYIHGNRNNAVTSNKPPSNSTHTTATGNNHPLTTSSNTLPLQGSQSKDSLTEDNPQNAVHNKGSVNLQTHNSKNNPTVKNSHALVQSHSPGPLLQGSRGKNSLGGGGTATLASSPGKGTNLVSDAQLTTADNNRPLKSSDNSPLQGSQSKDSLTGGNVQNALYNDKGSVNLQTYNSKNNLTVKNSHDLVQSHSPNPLLHGSQGKNSLEGGGTDTLISSPSERTNLVSDSQLTAVDNNRSLNQSYDSLLQGGQSKDSETGGSIPDVLHHKGNVNLQIHNSKNKLIPHNDQHLLHTHSRDPLLHGGHSKNSLRGRTDTHVSSPGKGTNLVAHPEIGTSHIGLPDRLSLGSSLQKGKSQSGLLDKDKHKHEMLTSLEGMTSNIHMKTGLAF